MIRRCAWCGTVNGEDHREPVGAITDGICHDCATRVRAEWGKDEEDTKHGETPAATTPR